MKNINYFFWGWFIVKLMVLGSFGYLGFNFKGITEQNSIFQLLFFGEFLFFALLKFIRLRKFGNYIVFSKAELYILAMTALVSKNNFLLIFCFIIVGEILHYYKEFCVIKPSNKFDGDEYKNESN